jgi:hypothetical protein
MKTFLSLLVLLLALPVGAQTTIRELDSLYQIAPPYKKMIKHMGAVSNLSVSLLRLEEQSSGDDVQLCRVGITREPIISYVTYRILRDAETYYVLLTKQETTQLIAILEKLYSKTTEERPGVYLEYAEELRTRLTALGVYMYANGDGKGWTLRLDKNLLGDRGLADLKRARMPKLIKLLKECAAILN